VGNRGGEVVRGAHGCLAHTALDEVLRNEPNPDWDKGVDRVAMESTGVYWTPVFNLLESDFDVILVDAHRRVKPLGRKKALAAVAHKMLGASQASGATYSLVVGRTVAALESIP
jgi:transposase